MVRIAGVIVAAIMFSTDPGRDVAARAAALVSAGPSADLPSENRAPLDVAALLSQARGAPPMICSLAAQSLRNFGWGDAGDAPSTPLSSVSIVRDLDSGPEAGRAGSTAATAARPGPPAAAAASP